MSLAPARGMRRTLLIVVAIFGFACNRGAQQTSAPNATAAGSPAATASPGEQPSNGAGGNSTVQLVGCLQGPARPAADAGAPPNGTPAESTATTARYVLTHVTVESGGVGANGAGASAGPLIAPGTSVDLDGIPANAQNSVNKQVRIVGRIDPRPASTAAATRPGSAAPRNSGTSGSGVGAATEVPGTTAGTTGSASPRDDVRANSSAVAGGVPAGAAARRVTVERVETIAQSCTAR